MPLDQGAEDVLEKLNPWLLDRKETNRWPGTILYDGYTASVFTFTLNDCTKKILIESSSSLYSWRQPFLPEDLCFLREDGREWLVTIAHENEAYLALEPEEKEYIQYAIPALLLRED